MQINSVNNVNPNFGMAIKATPEAMHNLNKSLKNVSDWIELDKFVTREENNDFVDVSLSAVGKKISAQVGAYRFDEGFFVGPMKVIRRAADKADGLRAQDAASKLEADTDFAQNIRNRVEVLPSQKEAQSIDIDGDDVVEIIGKGKSEGSGLDITA
ncbi:MAG: hypothetical protein NC191_08755 [Muribaculaceae bacterium]|nr:hypothetical protein [Muribaculaceae bacterium]